MFGISADRDVSMKDFYAGLHPLDRYDVTEAFAAAVDPRRRALYDVEYRTIGKEDGVLRWVAARGRGQFTRDGRCTRVIGTAIDITARKRDEARLVELNEALGQRLSEYLAERKLLADIVDGTDAFVQVADLNFRWLAINRASADEFERIFGKRPGVGLSMLDLLEDQPEHQAAVRAVWARALSGEEFVEVGVFGMPERRRRHYEMRFRNLYDEEGRRIGAYQFVYDVTARIESEERLAQAEEALHQAQKMEAVGRLTGGIAHDFNNLLQVFRTLFEMVRLRPGNADVVKNCGERGVAATEKAARLTAQLLTFSRQQPLDVRPLHLRTVFETLETLLRTTIGTAVNVEIRPHAVPQSLHVLADATQLEMALLNVAINARDAMPQGGTLSFSVDELPDGFVTVRATDTGQGMAPDVLRKAFDPFFTTKGVGKGSGLGLSQVYGMAQRANGSVALESTVGIGTTVLIRLRRAESQEKSDGATGSALDTTEAPRTSSRVLLVDDDVEVRTSIADMLGMMGHTCVEASGGHEALTILGREQFDLMLVDFAMPGMDGATVARRAREGAPGMRIAMMSGYADLEAIEAALGPGEVLLRKPFQMADLQSALNRLHRR
jgi:PAS domain S-box-containing protein